ncbi:Hypothetical protein SRAE_1000260000 [Strongyloides ratti]|uniref:Uncharacterized protein n=1 Tax=Strongyloides ratti TaxID=34506 RepID=A0A090L3G1_STRRB|nr:Hypothetical protein SRAE_1000260000 [Strongyloides ratti]CEF64346.1 Hypothetical protein SRAE_1000260000 [Strongyloides ratti]
MDAWEIKTILEKVPLTKKGKKQYLYRVRWADSLVNADDFPNKSVLQAFENGSFDCEIIGPVKQSRGKSLIDITNVNWLVRCKRTGQEKEMSYKDIRESFPEQLIKFYEINLAQLI